MSPIISRLSTPFGFATTAAQVVENIDLSGKRIIVTGASSGIGVETARALARTGAEVTLAVRDVSAGGRVAAEITASTANRNLPVARLDLADRASIADFVTRWRGPLHVLVNNAGIMASPAEFTADGWELQFATNHLGHFALAMGLQSALAAAGDARIVSVSSVGHVMSPVVFDDLHFAFRRYDPLLAYGQSKTANILFAVEATRRWHSDGITANALMPGAIPTNLQRHLGGIQTAVHLRKTPAQGAATAVLLAASPLLDGVGGRYFADCNECLPVARRTGDLNDLALYAINPENARRLWDESLRMIG